jgi:hypothetical protein
MNKIQQSLEEVKQTTGKLKKLCDLEARLYKDNDVFSSQIKKNTNKIQIKFKEVKLINGLANLTDLKMNTKNN